LAKNRYCPSTTDVVAPANPKPNPNPTPNANPTHNPNSDPTLTLTGK